MIATPTNPEAAELLVHARRHAEASQATAEPSPTEDSPAPEPLLETASQAQRASLELGAKLSLFIDAISHERADSIGGAFAKSVDFEPDRPAEIEPAITRKVLVERIEGLTQQAELCAAMSTCLAGFIEERPDNWDWQAQVVARELSSKVNDLYCAALEAGNGDGFRPLREVLR